MLRDPVDGALPVGGGGHGDLGGHLGEGRHDEAEQGAGCKDCNGKGKRRMARQPAALGLRWPGALCRDSLAQPVEHDGQGNDGEACFHRLADLERPERQQHVISQAPRPDHGGDDDHVQREHDDLVHAHHKHRPCGGDQHSPKPLTRRAARHVGEVAHILGHAGKAQHGGPHHRRRRKEGGCDQGGDGIVAKQKQHRHQIGKGRHRLHEIERRHQDQVGRLLVPVTPDAHEESRCHAERHTDGDEGERQHGAVPLAEQRHVERSAERHQHQAP